MKAVLCTQYGPPEVLQLRDVKRPIPKDREILIKIRATAVTSSDCFVRSAIPSAPLAFRIIFRIAVGITRPRNPILGLVLAGEVEQTGKAVTRFRAGDRVYAFTKFRFGAYAQYTCLPESGTIALAPSNVSDEEVAAIPYGGLLALHFLRKGGICKGQRVLVYGASGAVGTSALQLAKHFGANVTAACGPSNVELVRSLGADAVLDYTKQNVPSADVRYDLVLDAVGKRKTSALKSACKSALVPDGKYVCVDDGSPRLAAGDLALLKDLVEAGELKPVVDRRYALEQMAAAHEYVGLGHKKGNVVVGVSHEDE
jgi:NADPH:quinone reductase-like Zn-dependent oxidoreductase